MAEMHAFEWPPWIVTQRSDFGGLVYFVPDDATVVEDEEGLLVGWGTLRRYEPGVVYRAAELAQLVEWQPSPEDLRTLHEVKRLFSGQLVVEPRPRRTWTVEEVTAAWRGWPIPVRERYLELRLQALARLGVRDETEATDEQRFLAASWAAERASPEGEEP